MEQVPENAINLVTLLNPSTRLMCRDRIAVEWGFAKLKNLFKMLTFKVPSIKILNFNINSTYRATSRSDFLLLPCISL